MAAWYDSNTYNAKIQRKGGRRQRSRPGIVGIMEEKRKITLSNKELKERIEKNFERLQESYYQIDNVFADASYDWPGDKEGRALLAFVSHYKIHKRRIPCMDLMVEQLEEKTNSFYYFGHEPEEVIDEQQLSGQSWYLRGLLEYYEQFGDERMLTYAKETVEHLYMPLKEKIHFYPLERNNIDEGGVSGSLAGEKDGWKLSTDIGCVFMCVDGLTHYYKVTKDEKTKCLIEELRLAYDGIDVVALKAQTHCFLTAARGFLRMYGITGEKGYYESALRIAKIYIESGMTDTYQNYNWWGKGNTWTEPCAIVDSLMVMTELYKITKEPEYRTLAARIWHNGFSALQVGNGGAGTDTTVNSSQPELYTLMYEAYFCCTMRLAEGLWYINENKDLLYAETDALRKDEKGRWMAGDILYAQRIGEEEMLQEIEKTEADAADQEVLEAVICDGIRLLPLVKYYRLPKEVTDVLRQKVIF